MAAVLVPTNAGEAAEYDALIPPRDEENQLVVRTIERAPGHWYARFDDITWELDCPNGATDFVTLEGGDYRPREVPIRHGRFHAALRQVNFEFDPFVSSGTFVLSGRLGPRRAWGRRLTGSIRAYRVGGDGTVCSERTFFGARRFS